MLSRYRDAFSVLDAGAAKAVWPTVDEKALGRAFDQLQQQTLEFDECAITVTGAGAVASCGGNARYVPKVGNKSPRTEAREWRFSLRKVNEEWLIEAVDFSLVSLNHRRLPLHPAPTFCLLPSASCFQARHLYVGRRNADAIVTIRSIRAVSWLA